jgi:ribosomal protein S18 acetylase RimI-like enzyme
MGEIEIRRMNGDDEAWSCADLMATTDPWITLGRGREQTYSQVTHSLAETSVAVADGEIVGVVVVVTEVPLINGYIAALAVKKGHRNRGIGARLLAHAE